MEERHRHHTEMYLACRREAERAIACLRVEVAASIADDVEAKVHRAMTAAYNLGFIDGVKTHDEYTAEVEADNAAHGE